MKLLLDNGFDEAEINEFLGNTPEVFIKEIATNDKLVNANLKYIKKLGIKTYKEIFINYPDMFLMDNSSFIAMFSKYNTEELVAKLNKNFKTIEYL